MEDRLKREIVLFSRVFWVAPHLLVAFEALGASGMSALFQSTTPLSTVTLFILLLRLYQLKVLDKLALSEADRLFVNKKMRIPLLLQIADLVMLFSAKVSLSL